MQGPALRLIPGHCLPARVNVAAKLQELGISLPPPLAPVASYLPVVVSGNLAFVSGQIARKGEHVILKGKVGDALSVEQGAQAAREATLAGLASLHAEGLLDRIARVVKVTGYVASAPNFAEQSKVVNGASDLLVQIWGDAGKHARAALGVTALPL